MTAYILPAPDAPAEEWGRLAVSIPGWRWMPGILNEADGTRYVGNGDFAWEDPHRHHASGIGSNDVPDPDDPATAGCLLALLGHGVYAIRLAGLEPDGTSLWQWDDPTPDDAGEHWRAERLTLGRACIAAAAALGRWPGGEG